LVGSRKLRDDVEVQTTGFEVRSVGDYVALGCVDCGRTLDQKLLAANIHTWLELAKAHTCQGRKWVRA